MAVFCSGLGLFAAFAAAVYFSDPEIVFSDVKQIWEGIRDIKGNVLFVCLFIGGMAVAFFDLYQYYGYLRERNSLRDECFKQSQIIGEGVCLSLDMRFTRRNLNLFVLGGSGVGKSRNLVKPNILQGNSSFVVTDPSGNVK